MKSFARFKRELPAISDNGKKKTAIRQTDYVFPTCFDLRVSCRFFDDLGKSYS